MKSVIENSEGLSRRIKIDIPVGDVKAAFDKSYKDIQKNVTIKGFRKGKAPIATVKSMYSENVKQDVLQSLVSHAFQKALREHKLQPLGEPNIQINALNEEADFTFTAEFDTRPEVKIKKWEGLELKKEKVEVSEERIQSVLENIRQGHADLVPVFEERPAQNGDVAVIDFEGFVDGAPLPNGSATDHNLELGSKQFIEGFEEQVVGMKTGEVRQVKTKFPDAYHEPSIAGKPVEFKVTLKSIKKKSLPEINDDLAKKINYDSIDQLKGLIVQDILQTEEKRAQDDLKQAALRELVKLNPVEVPPKLMEKQKEALLLDVDQRLTEEKATPEQIEEYKKKWAGEIEDTAKFMVQSALLIDTLADEQKLHTTHADMDARLDLYAKQTGLDRKRIEEFYGDSERRSRLSYQITEEKVVKHILDKAKIEEVKKEDLPKEA